MQPIAIATRAANQAGKLLLQRFQHLHARDVNAKSAHELVTVADKAANRLIQKMLRQAFPAIGVLSEEGHNRPGRLRWVIDPLDGTTNFVLHVPFFGVSIALMDGNMPLFGVITCPPTKEIFIGARGQGATKNGQALRRQPAPPLRQAIIGYGYTHSARSLRASLVLAERLSHRVRSVRHAGSTALDLAYLAAGRLDAVIIAGPINLWDVAAGVIIAQEAGYAVQDGKGKVWTPKSHDVFAGPISLLKKLHNRKNR
ncbi:MAG: inositol monophosphatase [Patescibacteria group bacterium]